MEWEQLCVGESQAGGGQDEKPLIIQSSCALWGPRKKRLAYGGTVHRKLLLLR
jgi:hypothetical protein